MSLTWLSLVRHAKCATEAVQNALSRSNLLVAVLISLVVIVLGVGLGWEGNKLIPANPSSTAHYQQEPTNRLSFLSNWDGPIYVDIAQNGYVRSHSNFFPLYPLMIRIVMTVIRSPLISSLVVAWVSLVGAVYFYLKIVQRLFHIDSAAERVRAILPFILFPTAIFFVVAYTESLFTLLALGAVYFALAKRWMPAALFAMLSSATHVNGVFVALFAALLLWEGKEKLVRCAAVAVIGSLGFVGYLTFLAVQFHSPLVFLMTQASHSTPHFNPLTILTNMVARNGVFFVLLVIAMAYWWRQRRLSFVVYTLLYACIIILGGRGMSGLGRYTLAAYPVPLMLYDYFRAKPLGYATMLALTSVGWAYFMLLYAAGYTGG